MLDAWQAQENVPPLLVPVKTALSPCSGLDTEAVLLKVTVMVHCVVPAVSAVATYLPL